MEPLTILAALVPSAIDGIKALIGKFTGNKPTIVNSDDYEKVTAADVSKLNALAALDSPAGNVSVWVNNVRAMQRPPVVYAVTLAWLIGAFGFMPEQNFVMVSNIAATVFFYLFGDRTNLYFKRGR